jgi:methylphosphotriester-DNA--protein-cysteine methyltransferase
MDRALAMLYEAPGDTSTDTVIRASGLGLRQFQRRFKAIMGVGPKRFQRLARFYKLVRGHVLRPQHSYLPAALDLGFYDQPHVVHEFRALVGRAPGVFLREVVERTHFYNPSRRSRPSLVLAAQSRRM